MKGGRLSSIKLELSEMKSKQVTHKESGLETFQALDLVSTKLMYLPSTKTPFKF
jgi:hypothetical protein